jgi:CheY-like chemotaxis protein
LTKPLFLIIFTAFREYEYGIMVKKRILWVDDEIELLEPHILFLNSKGYEVERVTNGEDAVVKAGEMFFDLILLDEMMPGKDGLATLQEIKALSPQTPVIMITKSEEESLMDDAIGQNIDDYLTKPVNPSQILLACKKILDSKEITSEKRSRMYAQELQQVSLLLSGILDYNQWIELYLKLTNWDLELDSTSEPQFGEILKDQRRECNVEFGKYIEKNYHLWLENREKSPVLSTDLVKKYIIPSLEKKARVALLVIDCMRLDQWMVLAPFFYEYFNFSTDYYYSILPTATPFSRNAIFSGLFPKDIERKYPDLWCNENDDETSMNRYEKELLNENLIRNGYRLKQGLKYIKIINNEDTRQFEKNINNYLDTEMLAIVLNFVDVLAHSRSDLPILKEIAPNESAFRSLTRSWFEHSPVLNIIKAIAAAGYTLFVTSDHGSIRGMRGTKVIGDRESSTNLRYKSGRNLKVDKKHAIFIKNPDQYRLPHRGINTSYIITKEDYYLVYPTNYYKYLNHYKDSFQHGGASMEEMILPIVRLESRIA